MQLPPRRRSPGTIDILVVCTANVCRSPYIAGLLAAANPDLAIRSAGTSAADGDRAAPQIVEALGRRAITLTDHRAHRLTRGVLRQTRLVVTATRLHRVIVGARYARSVPSVFTLKELARLLRQPAGATDHGIDAVIRRAGMALRDEPPMDHDDDLADPFGLGPEHYARMFAEVDEALAVLGPALAGPGP